MFRIIIALVWLALAFPCQAQMTTLGAGGTIKASVASYTGPLDISGSAFVWVGLRAGSSAKRGSAAINLCDDTLANCSDVVTSATTGILNAGGTHGSNNCDTSGTCLVKIAYDQSGNSRNLSCSVAANCPKFKPNCIGSLPCLQYSGTTISGQVLTGAGGFSQALPMTFSAVYDRTGNTTVFGPVLVGYDNPVGIIPNTTTNTTNLFAGSVSANVTAADSSFHAVQGLLSASGTASSMYVDGTLTGSLSTGTTAWATVHIGLGADNAGNRFLLGFICEAGMWGSDTTANNSTMNSNQHTFWGF